MVPKPVYACACMCVCVCVRVCVRVYVACSSPKADVVFVVDSSASIGIDNFRKVKTFIKGVVRSFNVSHEAVRVGLVQFSDDDVIELDLRSGSNVFDVTQAVSALHYFKDGNTRHLCIRYSTVDKTLLGSPVYATENATIYSTRAQHAVAGMGDRLATTDMGRKVGAAVSLSVGGAGSPSNTMSPGPRPTSVPTGILIHPAVWSQYTNVTDRQTGQRSRSIGRTVSFNGRPKTLL